MTTDVVQGQIQNNPNSATQYRYTSRYEDIDIPVCTLQEAVLGGGGGGGIDNHVAKDDKVAIVDGASGFSITYAQLRQFTNVIALNLQHRFGFAVEDHVPGTSRLAILLPNHPLYPCLFLGVLTAGGCNTTMNPLYTPDEVRKQLVDSSATILVTLDMFLDKCLQGIEGTAVKHVLVLSANPVQAVVDRADGVQVLDFKSSLLAPPVANLLIKVHTIDPLEHLCVLPYSSGTSGHPKGVMLTHHNLVSNIHQIGEPERIMESDVVVAVLPFFHIYGMAVILSAALRNRATVVSMPKFDMELFLRIVQEHKVTRAHLVPPIILGLAKHPIVDKYDISSLRAIVSGAAPLSKELVTLAKSRPCIQNIVLKQGYGMTESSPVITVCPDEEPVPGSSGVIVSNTVVRLVDVTTGEEVSTGQEGEVQIQGPQVMKGYLGQPEATAQTIRDGWLCTGDVGIIDESGHLYIVDRVKELIKYRGYQVPPAELEGILQKMDSVADVAVIGVPDEEVGELPKAFIVPKPGVTLTEDDVKRFMEDKVAPYKKIRLVEFVNEIPKSASGKILRRLLRERK